MAEGDVDLGAFLDKYSPTPAPTEDLPERKAKRTTYYYPATPEATRAAGLSYGMEGGIHGGGKFSNIDLREHTLEKFQQGKTDWVAVAMEGVPTGEKFRTTADGKPIIARNVDTGGGLRPGQHDIATEDPQKAKTGGEGGGAPQIPGISPMMQIALEEPPAKPAQTPEPQQAPSGGGAGFTPTPAPQFTAGPPVQLPKIPQGSGMTPTPPIPTTPQDIDLGAFLASRQMPTPTPQPSMTPASAPQDIDLGQFLASRVSPHEFPAPPSQPQSAIGNAVQAAYEVGTGFIPKSLDDVNQFFEPAIAAPAQIRQGYDAVKSFIGGTPINEIARQIPQSQLLVEADKTPPFSKERFKAGFETVAQLATAAGVGKGAFPRTVSPGLKAPPAQKPPPGGRQVAVVKSAAAEPVAGARVWHGEDVGEKSLLALQGNDGTIYIDTTGGIHTQILDKLGLQPEDIKTGGYVTGNKYKTARWLQDFAEKYSEPTKANPNLVASVPKGTAEAPIREQAVAKPAAAEPPTTPPGGNGPPSEINRESGEPMPEHPESGALAEASKGNMFSRIARAFRSFRDTFTIEPLPNLRRAGLRDSGYAHASSRNAIMPVVRDMISRVFPEQYKDQVAMKVTGDVLVKDNVLGIYDQIKAQLARADLTAQERTRLTQNMADLEGSVAQYDAEVRAAMQDPTIAANVERWKQWVNPEMERMYRELRNEDPNANPDPRGRYTGARVNLLPMFKAESMVDMLDFTKPMPEPSYSNYRNPNVKADPFGRHAKGTGEYSNDPMLMLINSFGQRYVETTKLAFYKDIVANGQGIITEPGTHVGNKDLTRMPAKMPETNPETGKVRTVEKSLWVNKQIADEVRQVLNVDKLGGGNPLFQWATGLQLMQGIDMTAHLKNIHTVIANSLGQSAMGDLARRFPGVATVDATARMAAVTKEVMSDSPAIRAEIADMARRGEIRPKYPSTGISKITKGQEIIHEADTAARIIMKRFWENNVRRGRAVDNPDARRQFINKIGEYNQRVMNDYQRRVRALGLSPFVVAGRSFNAFSRRLIFGSIGFKPKNLGQAVLLRSLNLTSLAVTTATVAAFNYAITGKPGGRSGVPLGAIDTGKNDDKGKPIVVDVFHLIGIRRGLRATGIGAVIEGMRKGQTAREIGTQAVKDVISTAASPWYGPGLQTLTGVLWGKRLDLRSGDMYQIGRKLKPGEGIQELENVRATLRDTNPLIYSLISPVFGEAQNKQDIDQNWGSRLYEGAVTPMERSVGLRSMTKQEMTGTPYEKKKSTGTPVFIGK